MNFFNYTKYVKGAFGVFAPVLATMLSFMTLLCANSVNAADFELVVAPTSTGFYSSSLSASEGSKIFFKVKANDPKSVAHTFVIIAPDTLRSVNTVQIKLNPDQMLSEAVEYTLPFSLGVQSEAGQNYTLKCVEDSTIVVAPAVISAQNANNLVNFKWTTDKASYLEGETVKLTGHLLNKDGSPFDYSKNNQLNKQLAATLTVPFSLSSNLVFEKVPQSITFSLGQNTTTIDLVIKQIVGAQPNHTITVKSDIVPESVLGINNAQASFEIRDDQSVNPTEASLTVSGTSFKALDEVTLKVTIQKTNNSLNPLDFDVNISHKDILADKQTGKRYTGKVIKISVPVDKATGEAELRFTPEASGQYEFTLAPKAGFKINSKTLNVNVTPVSNIRPYEISLSLAQNEIKEYLEIFQGDTTILYVSSFYQAENRDYFRMGLPTDTSRSVSWTVDILGESQIKLTDISSATLSNGESQKEVLLTSPANQGVLGELIYTFIPSMPILSNNVLFLNNSVRVSVQETGKSAIAIAMTPNVAKNGQFVEFKSTLGSVAAAANVTTGFYISPKYSNYIDNYSALFNDSGYSKDTQLFTIKAGEQSSNSISLKINTQLGNYFKPIKIPVSPYNISLSSLTWRQSTLTVIDDTLNMSISRVKDIQGDTPEPRTALYEGEDVYFKLTLDRNVEDEFTTRIYVETDEYITTTPIIDFTVKAGYDYAVVRVKMSANRRKFEGSRNFILKWDNHYEKDATSGEFNKAPMPTYTFIDNPDDIQKDFIFKVIKPDTGFIEGDTIHVLFNLGMPNESGKDFLVPFRLTSTATKVYREIHDLKDSYIIVVPHGTSEGKIQIKTDKRIRLQNKRVITLTAFPENYNELNQVLDIDDDPNHVAELFFTGVVPTVVEGNVAKMRAFMTLGNNSDEDLIITIRGENALADRGYPDWDNPLLEADYLKITMPPDTKEVFFEMKTADLKSKFESRQGKIEIVKYPINTAIEEKPYLLANNKNPLNIILSGAPIKPTYAYIATYLEYDGGRTVTETTVKIKEPMTTVKNKVRIQFKQVSGTIPKEPRTLEIDQEGSLAVEGLNYNFIGPDESPIRDSVKLLFVTHDKDGLPLQEIVAELKIDFINDYINDKTERKLSIALKTNYGTESSESGREQVSFIIQPYVTSPMNKAGVGFAKYDVTPIVFTSSEGHGFSIFCSNKIKNTTVVTLSATGLKHGVEYRLGRVGPDGQFSEVYQENIPNTFRFEITPDEVNEDNGNGWITLKFIPINPMISGAKDKRFSLKMISAIGGAAINKDYASTSLILRNDNPYANIDQLAIPLDRQKDDQRYIIDCLKNDKSWRSANTSYLTGIQVFSCGGGTYGEPETFSGNVYYNDLCSDTMKSFFDVFQYTARELGQGVSSADVYVYKAQPQAIDQKVLLPLFEGVTAPSKLIAYYFDPYKDIANKKPKKLAMKYEGSNGSHVALTLVGKVQMSSNSAINDVLKSNNFSADVLDSTTYQIKDLGIRICSSDIKPAAKYGEKTLATTILTAPRLRALTDTAIIKLKNNEFAVEIDGDYFSSKPTFYIEYMHNKTYKIKRVKTPILNVLQLESGAIRNVKPLQNPGKGAKFYVKFPLIAQGAPNQRVDFLAFNKCAYAALKDILIYKKAWEEFPQYASPKIRPYEDFDFYLSDKNEMIVGIMGDYMGSNPKFTLTYVDVNNKFKSVNLKVLSKFKDNKGKDWDVKAFQHPKINGLFCVKMPIIFQSLDKPNVSLIVDNGHSSTTATGINYNGMINNEYPTLHTPSLQKVTATLYGDIYPTSNNKIIVRVTGDHLGEKPTFYARYKDKNGKLSMKKLKIVTKFYQDNGYLKDVKAEQDVVLGAKFYLEMPSLTPFNNAQGAVDIVVTTTGSAISTDFYSAVKKVIYPQR